MTDGSPTIAVVIATRDRPTMLRGALEALHGLSRPADRVVVVDSASIDPRVRQVAEGSGAVVVRCEVPGLGRARNAGLAAVDEELVAFTDDDCLPRADWLDQIVTAFGRPSCPDFVTGAVLADRDPARRLGISVALTTELTPHVLDVTGDPRSFGHGANMAWRRGALERLGWFDESMGVGSLLRAGEDIDVWWRAVYAGMIGSFVPEAVVVHRQWRNRRSALRSYYGYGVGVGAVAVKRYRAAVADGRQSSRSEMARRLVLDEGLAPVWRSLRRGYQMAAMADTLMFLGGLRGAWLASGLPVVDGTFRSASAADGVDAAVHVDHLPGGHGEQVGQ